MKIIILNFEYPPLGGGGGIATRDIAIELSKNHEVHILTSRQKGLRAFEIQDGVNVHRVWVTQRKELATAPLLSMVTFVLSVFIRGLFVCKKVRPDVINAQFVVPSGIPATALAKIFNIPMVLSFVGGDLYDPTKGLSPHRHWWLKLLIRWISEQAAIATAISADTRKRAMDIHGVTKEIIVTHLGFKPPFQNKSSKEDVGLNSNGLVLISIGRLIPRKGFEILLGAIKNVPEARLIIVGSGPLKHKLKKLIEHLGLEDRVQLRGYVDEKVKHQLLSASDVYVSAAEHEGFGIVFLEAMHWGLPVIAANNGGHRDFLMAGENAILVPPGDSSQLALAIKKLLDDTALRGQLSVNNRKKVREFYLEKTAAVFEDVLIRSIRK